MKIYHDHGIGHWLIQDHRPFISQAIEADRHFSRQGNVIRKFRLSPQEMLRCKMEMNSPQRIDNVTYLLGVPVDEEPQLQYVVELPHGNHPVSITVWRDKIYIACDNGKIWEMEYTVDGPMLQNVGRMVERNDLRQAEDYVTEPMVRALRQFSNPDPFERPKRPPSKLHPLVQLDEQLRSLSD